MKVLFIGGTGLISSACAELAIQRGHELLILNRAMSAKHGAPQGATLLTADVHAGPAGLSRLLNGYHFDAVVDFIGFSVQDIERDLNVFDGKTEQFVFMSSASAYQ